MSAIRALEQHKLLLQMEYACEKEEFRRQTEAVGMNRKVKRGDAWWQVRVVRSYYNSLNQLAVEIYRTEDTDVEHNFEFGRPVCFFKLDAQNGTAPSSADAATKTIKLMSRGTVSYADGDRMVIVVPDNTPVVELQNTENIGVQLYFDETSYRLMFEALDRVISAKDNRLAYLRELFHSKQKAETFAFEPMRFPWLNATQEQAVNQVLRSKDVAIVHGPPGTGKTTTLVEAVCETLRRENQVLVCAQSNMAVDWISERLLDRGVNVLRIGNPTKVNDKMLSFTYERRFEDHPDYPQLWSIRQTIRQMRQSKKMRGTAMPKNKWFSPVQFL